MSRTFIDVSQWQGNLEVGKTVKDNGYSGAMIRVGSGVGIDDSKAYTYANSCKSAGVKYGFYHYGYIGYGAENTASSEAKYFIERVKPYYYDGIVLAYDFEEYCTTSASQIYDFCERVQKAYPKAYVMIYTNGNHYNRLNINPNKFAVWFAKPDKKYENNTGISNICAKQYHFGENGGSLGNLDLNADYKDIFNIMVPKPKETKYYAYVDYELLHNQYKYLMRINEDRAGAEFSDIDCKNVTGTMRNLAKDKNNEIVINSRYVKKFVRNGWLWYVHEYINADNEKRYFAYKLVEQ